MGDPALLVSRLLAEGAPVVLGLDLPLGLPRAYAKDCAAPDFPAFLRALTARPDFFAVNPTLATIGRERPFYPARGLRGMTRANSITARFIYPKFGGVAHPAEGDPLKPKAD